MESVLVDGEKLRPDFGNVFEYDPRRYFIDVLLPTYVSCVGLPVSLVLLCAGFLPPLMLLVVVVCAYSLWNAFVAHAYPRTIAFDGKALRLESFGRVDELGPEELRGVRVNQTPEGLREYVRLAGSTPFAGRYFLVCGDMRDASGLNARAVYDYLLRCARSRA